MPEYPMILAQNALDGATLSMSPGAEVVGHELDRLRDGYRHTWWEAPSTAVQYIYVRAKNLIANSGFEADLVDWFLYKAGGASGTMERNTTSPINGSADCKLDATDANDTDKVFKLLSWKSFQFRAGRTYRMMFRSRATGSDAAARFGFTTNSLEEDPDFYTEEAIGQTGDGHFVDVTPTDDARMRPFIRIMENNTVYIDDVVVNEVRDVDTIVIDRGHSLALGVVGINRRQHEAATAWANAMADTPIPSDGPVCLTFEGVKSLSWRIKIATQTAYPYAPVAQAPLIYLGKRWTLPRHFSGGFDPHGEALNIEKVMSERGIAQCLHKYSQRLFRANLSHISNEDYKEVARFFEDTDNGEKPFFFSWKPDTDPGDLLCMKLAGGRNVPYTSGTLRQWAFDAEEVVGYRVV